jgi:hypothetical protein
VLTLALLIPSTPVFADVVALSDGVAWGEVDLGNPCTQNIRAITRGFGHTVLIGPDHAVDCFGDDSFGQCTPAEAVGPASAIAAGLYHTVALRSNGTVACWGMNFDGQCSVPSGLADVVAISAGEYFSVALRSNGGVVCWGSNSAGESTAPSNLGVVTAIDAGAVHTIARRTDGTVRCWGAGTTSAGSYPNFGQSMPPAGLSTVTNVTAGSLFSAARRANGTVVCWGRNDSGQCNVPADLGAVTSIAAGSSHMTALLADGTVRCWGSNGAGESQPPTGMRSTVAIEAAYRTSYALHSVGAPDCNGNGVEDASEIAAGISRDVNGTGVPDECEFPNVCSGCDPAPVDVLLVVDNSGSMTMLPAFCTRVLAPAAAVLRSEFDLQLHWFDLVGSAYGSCGAADGVHLIPAYTLLPGPECDSDPLQLLTDEDWAYGAAILSDPRFAQPSIAWKPRDAVTIIMVLSDEAARAGNPCGNEDAAALQVAIDAARSAAVVHVPVAFPDALPCVYSANVLPLGQMDQLALASGGAVLDARAITDGPSAANTLLATTLATRIRNAVAASPRIHCATDPCPADVSGDCDVGAADLAFLLAAWNSSDEDADIDRNGLVDATDLAFLLTNWGACP